MTPRCIPTPDGWTTPDGTPCPDHHCAARPRCGTHLPPGQLACPTCLGHTRDTLARIVDLAALMLPEATHRGVNSEAAMLAGPAADPEAWTWRKITARQGRVWHITLETDDDDDTHPLTVLGGWDRMIREDYGPDATTPLTVAGAADYLNTRLHRIAHDPHQDFPLLARELHACCTHLEAVLHDTRPIERGAPCPDCSDRDGYAPPLVKHYIDHDPSGASDWWGCPACCARWTEADYRHRVGTRYLNHADALTASQIRAIYCVPEGTIRRWANDTRGPDGKPSVGKRGKDRRGCQLYDVADVQRMRDVEAGRLIS